MDIEMGISLLREFQSPGWNINLTADNKTLIFEVPDQEQAELLLARALKPLAASAKNCNCGYAILRYPNCGDHIFRIPAKMANSDRPINNQIPTNKMSIQNPLAEKLVGADYIRIHEFLIDQKRQGNIVIITSNITRDNLGNPISTENPVVGRDICHHTSDELTPQRAYWTAKDFTGWNYRKSWRRDFNDYEHLNPQYHRLKEALERDGFAENYEYTLYRPDGAFCSYSTSYYLCNGYLNDIVRIGVSKPGDWKLITHPEEFLVN